MQIVTYHYVKAYTLIILTCCDKSMTFSGKLDESIMASTSYIRHNIKC